MCDHKRTWHEAFKDMGDWDADFKKAYTAPDGAKFRKKFDDAHDERSSGAKNVCSFGVSGSGELHEKKRRREVDG